MRLSLISILFLSILGAPAGAIEISLAKILEQASHRSEFERPRPSELQAFYRMAVNTVDAPQDLDQLRTQWQAIGWAVDRAVINGSPLWIIHDTQKPRRGGGVFVIRPDASNNIMIQSPHSFYDKFTRAIGVRLFERSDIRFAAWNTVHRRVTDVAHEPNSYFHEFTRAVLDATDQTEGASFVVQLHGFAQESRKTKAGSTADLILSNGTRFPPAWLRMTTQNMRAVTPAVRLFPSEVSELGATTNAQAELANHRGSAFLHAEISQPLRRKLRRHDDAVDEFLKCILAAYRSQ